MSGSICNFTLAREKDPGQITELEKARALYLEYVIPEWFLKTDDEKSGS
jgi:hypothetical protein